MVNNLPIKRIVFLESSKFDGKSLRELNISEVKQISGRAGRIGMFEVGYVNAMVDKNIIKDILFSKYTPIQYAKIQLPKSLLNIDLPLSEIIKSWANIPDKGYFKKANTDIYLRLCLLLERYMPNLSKECILDLINIPFDENNEELERLWFELISLHFNNEDILDNMDILEVENKDTLEMLELKYKKLDLYYSFAKTVKYNRENFLTNISKLKEEISLAIIEQLKTKEIQRTCKLCKKVIAWDYPYSICQRCYTKRYY